MKIFSFITLVFCVYFVNCQEESHALTCEVFEVSGASDTSLNGKYEITPFNVTGASVDKEVYEKTLGGGKYMFYKNGNWALGSNKDTGEISYAGEFPTSRGANTTWQGQGNLRRSRIIVTNRSAICSEDFDNDEDYEYLGDISSMSDGRNGCRGALAIKHVPIRESGSTGYTRTFRATNYRNTWRVFRRRTIRMVEVWGTCPWRIYSQTRFRGIYQSLLPGFSSHLNFKPGSIAQLL